MDGLDLLGASGDSLSNQYVTFRIKRIDGEKLREKLGGSTGMLAAAGLHFVDAAPKAALDMAMPVIVGQVKQYGIDAEATVSNVPPSKGGRAVSEFFPGLVIGVGIGATSLLIIKAIKSLISR